MRLHLKRQFVVLSLPQVPLQLGHPVSQSPALTARTLDHFPGSAELHLVLVGLLLTLLQSFGLGGQLASLRGVLLNTERETERQTDRQTESQTERQTDRQTDRQTESQPERQTDSQTNRVSQRDRESDRDRQTDTQSQRDRHTDRWRRVEGK